MYKKMLIPLDGSELAEVVFPYAKELAGRLNIEVILLYVGIPARQEFAPMQRAYIERAADVVGRDTPRVVKTQYGVHKSIALAVHDLFAQYVPSVIRPTEVVVEVNAHAHFRVALITAYVEPEYIPLRRWRKELLQQAHGSSVMVGS